MTKTPKKSLDEIVREAQTLAPEDQLRYVREACASGDAALDTTSSGSLPAEGELADERWQAWSDSDVALVDPAGERIGPYRVVRSLGRGGMGEVFLAERADDQFTQQVAIKLVRRGLLSRQIQSRLRLERQILATLDHPNIARLFDGGTTSDGTPYIVMEYVDGAPIDTYCDTHALPIRERLKLFKTVCSAVHRAHQNLIVHRDLKPSNILVTLAGVPKLLDFGIAKVLDERQSMHTLAVTHADYRVMTPDHASPEQIRGELITTASDIYVLGVLLYELLCGYKPFALKGNRLAELERAICEDQAANPSIAIHAAISGKESSIGQIARDRSVTPAKLRRELHGDLDNIVSMAMRKEPERRYSSVEQLAADVDRFLDGLPIIARADSRMYRARKFVRRHAVVVVLSGAFVALLVGSTISTLIQSQRIKIERDVAQAERAAAQSQRERAEAVSIFLTDAFKLADPSKARGNQITAKEILDQGAARITRELRSQPELQATLLDTIGGVYLSLDQPAEAQPLIEKGLSLRRNLFGANNLDVARSLQSLSRVREKKGDYPGAQALAQQALTTNRTLTNAQSLETAGSLCQIGNIKLQKGELGDAEASFGQCLAIRIARLGRNDESVTPPLDSLARIAQARQDFGAAERLYREALDIDRQTREEDHPQYIRHLHNLATVVHARGDLAAAEPLYRRSIELFVRVLGLKHGETIDAMSNMGTLLLEQGKMDEAQKVFEQTLALNRETRGKAHAYVGYDLVKLGRLELKKGNLPQAELRIKEALDIYQQAKLPPGHGFIATAWTWLGRTYIEAGKSREAEAALQQAVDSWKIQYGDKSAEYAIARAFLGRAWWMQGRPAEAELALTESYPRVLESPRSADKEVAKTIHQWIEGFYLSNGHPETARKYFATLAANRSP
jgi:eukaryotic-like serine/threonine-protein kinase